MSPQLSPSERPMPELPGVRHAYAEVRGLRLHYAEAGPADAPPVLLVHGFPQHWYAWRHVIPLLSGDHRVICLDMPGFGWSEGAPGCWSTASRAADLVGFLDAVDLAAVDLVAHDWGAWAGFLACAERPERFRRFLALNMVHLWPLRENTLGNAWRFWYTVALEWPPFGRAVLRHWPAFTRFLMRRGVAHDIAALRRKEFDGIRLRTPTLVLTGAVDPVIPPRLLEGGEDFCDDLQVEVVPDAGHFLPVECPALVAGCAKRLFGS